MAESKIKNCVVVNGFHEDAVKDFKADFDELMSTSIPIIPIIIDSFGGEVYSLLAMLDIMSTANKPIATIALGKAMSCGSILLSSGTKGLRFVGPNATVMIHDVASISIGKIEELKADVGEGDRLNNRIYEILSKNCDKPKTYFQQIITEKKHVNWYLDSKEALKHGIVDHIGVPVIESLYNLDIIKESRLSSKQKNVKKPSKKPSKKK